MVSGLITMGKMTWISHQAWTPHIATVRAAPRISSQSVEAVAECFPRNESKRCSIKSCRRLLNASTSSILPKTNSWTEARWTLNYHLPYLFLSYHCLIIIYLIIVLSLSYHCLILCYCLAVHVDRDWGSTGLRVSAPFPPRLVCRKGRFCLSHIGGRQASKANVSGGSRVNLHRLGTSIVQTWHRSLMNYIWFRVGSQAVFVYHRSTGSIIRWLRDCFWRGLFDILKAP